MYKSLKTLIRATFLCSALLSAGISAAASQADLQVNIKDGDIRHFIGWVAGVTGKNFIIDSRVNGKVTVVSNNPVSVDEAYDIFLSVLQVNGYTAIETGSSIKVVPDAQAKQSGLPVKESDSPGDLMVVQVIKTRYITTTQLVPVLRPMVSQYGHLATYPQSNALIIADRASNIDQLVEVVRRIDLANKQRVETIPLEHADAGKTAEVIQKLMQKTGAEAQYSPLRLAVDGRTNSVMVSGNDEQLTQIRSLLKDLDQPDRSDGTTQVIYLHYLKASELAPILVETTNGLQNREKEFLANSSPVAIQANDATNAIIVTAPPAIMKVVQQVVRQLDIRRAQVLVEAVLVEVSEDTLNELGVLWGTSDSAIDGDGWYGGAGNSIKNFPGKDGALSAGLSLGFYRNGSLRFLVQALETDNTSNILSTPNLVTLDNEEGSIVVGQNVPFITGTSTNSSSSTDNPYQTIERKDVGITLKIKPQINAGDSVTLDVYQEVSNVAQKQLDDASDLITNKRAVETRVLVSDGDTLVLGGLLSDEQSGVKNKVPFLGDLPFIGWLFRSNSDQTIKKNLMVFIKPTIIKDKRTVEIVSGARYNFIRDHQHRYAEDQQLKNPLLLPEYGKSFTLETGKISDNKSTL